MQGSSRRTIRKPSEKTLTLSRLPRQAYFKMHCPNYDHEESHDLSCAFQEIATSTGLMGSEVH